MVANGQCIDRVCVKDGMLTIRYLHPTADSGKYICEAKSKYGKDQRQVHLTVKVIYNLFSYLFQIFYEKDQMLLYHELKSQISISFLDTY